MYGRPTKAIGTLTFHAGYATSRISSILNGRTKQFGWLQAPATNAIIGLQAKLLFPVDWESGAGLTHAATERRSISEIAVPIRLLAKIAVIRQLL